ncbi:ribonuclease HII [Candidatus Woesearchaeota archaeon]|nr:ribonuclease HII [Candidatus Woesearchaeota archaeon]
MLIAGIDEAGRGPVLGPLVMAAVVVDESGEEELRGLGVKDSKLLTKEKRDELFVKIRKIVKDFRVEVIEPDAIDLSLEEVGTNLNWLEADTSARLVSEMEVSKVIVDCPSVNVGAYRDYFFEKLTGTAKEAELVVEHKADLNYISVAAASIVAKVVRDDILAGMRDKIKIDFGSGYMSDPKTQKFLKEYHEEYADLFRKQWQSYKNVVEGKKQKKLGEF